jgi:hypothetical protein
MSTTNIFKCEMPTTSDYERGQAKTHQTLAESRDAPLPGTRNNPAMAVQNIHKAAPATGRRP